jgi:choline dehydrogenase-like flavoprotein
VEQVDVLIVGAGASAAAFAWAMAETRMHIVCLEQGDWVDHRSYPIMSPAWEARPDFSNDPNVRQGPADYPINARRSEIAPANFNAVGGATILYAGHFPRFHPSDFRVRTLDGVADDWPITYATLEPFYEINERMMGVSGLAGDPAYPPKRPVMPPLPLGKSGAALARGYNALGWHWWPSDCAINTVEYEGRGRCINLGACGLGCAQGAKASVDLTYWPAAIRAGVEVRPGSRVREITVDDHGMASGAIYHEPGGAVRRIAAHMVVVACNGIGTPRLLLNSTSPLFPNGLANSSGLVGKNLMFHPYGVVDAVLDHELDGNRGPYKGVASHQFYETDLDRGFVRGFSFEMQRGYGPAASAFVALQAGALPWGARHHDAYRELIDRTVSNVAVCEDLPEPGNEVTLDPEETDADGIPGARIRYALSKNSRRMMDFALDRGRELAAAAGAVRLLRQTGPARAAGFHLMGTARMGESPANSVVNAWGRSHDVKNLFIIDGSLFVTSAAVNPTATIQALALYVASQIKARLSNSTLFD